MALEGPSSASIPRWTLFQVHPHEFEVLYAVLSDAGIGHACGHNLIGMAGVGIALGIKAAMEAHNISGKVVLLGTPGMFWFHPVGAAALIFSRSGGRRHRQGTPPRKGRVQGDGRLRDVSPGAWSAQSSRKYEHTRHPVN